MELSSTFVCIMGMATVFAGLICLIIICSLLGVIFRNIKKETPAKSSNQTSAPKVAAPAASPIENREELVAAISAAVAEELGEDVTNIRILSLRRI